VIEGPDQGWTAPLVLGGLVVGAVLVACFVLWELRSRAPMFDVRVFLRRAVVGGGLAIFAVYMTFFGIVYLTPQYLQYVEGHSTLEVGVLMLPLGLVFALLSPFSAELSRRIGVRRVLTGGLVVMAAGLALLALVRDVAGSGVVLAGTAVYSVGWAAMMAPATTAIVNALPAAKAGDASSVNQITRQAGGAFGIAVIGSVFAAIYVGGVRAALPAEIAPAAERSIGSALEAAARHGGASSERLVEQATLAFDAAAQVAFLVAAGLALAGAAAAAIALRRS
jgi:predicted MFS family arabinose efflux permease